MLLDTIRVRRLSGTIGAELTGLDLSCELDDDLRTTLRAALDEHHVLFFPDQHLDDDAHRRFGAMWGELEVHPLIPHVDGFPEVIELSSERGVADTWHTDMTFSATPPTMSILRTITSPACGGDTMWSDQSAAYEALSAPMQAFLEPLTAVHAASRARGFQGSDREAVHPVVTTHPGTGRKVLYVNRLFTDRIIELTAAESRALLDLLLAHSEHPRFVVRYAWRPGTVAIWDNRCTQHFVVDDFQGLRVIRRVTVHARGPWCQETARPAG
jgi:taurine dioxygenase